MSTTVTRSPCSSRTPVSIDPMYPAPPVIKTCRIVPLHVQTNLPSTSDSTRPIGERSEYDRKRGERRVQHVVRARPDRDDGSGPAGPRPRHGGRRDGGGARRPP